MKRKIILFFALAVIAVNFSSCIVREHGYRHHEEHHEHHEHRD